jgi:hypothetical protein
VTGRHSNQTELPDLIIGDYGYIYLERASFKCVAKIDEFFNSAKENSQIFSGPIVCQNFDCQITSKLPASWTLPCCPVSFEGHICPHFVTIDFPPGGYLSGARPPLRIEFT